MRLIEKTYCTSVMLLTIHTCMLVTRGGHFTRYPKWHPNPIRKIRTEIRTEVAKYPNGY